MDFISLANNIALLISVSIVYSFISRRWEQSTPYHRVFTGILFGLTTVLGMLTPAQVMPGLIFDGRSIILAVAGLFTGGLATFIAALIAMAYRVSIGGPGMPMGVLVIASSSAIGFVFFQLRQRQIIRYTWLTLLTVGIIVHVAMFFCTFALPSAIHLSVLKGLIIPLTTIYPIGVLLVGKLFLDQELRIKADQDLVTSQKSYQNLVENVQSIIIKLSKSGKLIFINNHGLDILGFEWEALFEKMPLDTFISTEDPSAKFFTEQGCNLIHANDSITTEGMCRSKGGDVLYLIWTLTAYINDNNEKEILCIGNNITGLKGVQEALWESKQTLKNIMDNTQDLICQTDIEGKHVYVSPSYTTMLGYPAEDLIGKSFLSFVHAADLNICLESFKTLIVEKKPLRLAMRFRNVSNEYVWIESFATLIYNKNGTPVGTVTSSRNITERMEYQKALEYSELRYKTLMFAIPDLMFVQSREGVYLDVHCSDPTKLLLPPEQFLGKKHSEILPSSVLDIFEKKFEEITKRGGVEIFEYSLIMNHQVGHFEARITPFGPDKFLTIIREITDRKQAEMQVKVEEEKYRLLAENSSDVIWKMDVATQTLTYVSPSVFKLRGFTPEEAITQSLEESIDRESFLKIQRDLPRRIQDFYNGIEAARTAITQLQQPCKDGSWKWVEIVTTFVTDEKGEISEMIGVSRDITERKKIELSLIENELLLRQQNEEYQSINEELKESYLKIQEINQELTLAKDKAEESDRLKSAFLANMSHEIRTPMNGILGFSDLLRRPNLPPQKSSQYIDIINSNGHQLLSIINDIIDISKIEAKLVQIVRSAVNIGHLINALNDQFQPLAKSKGLSFMATNRLSDITVVMTDEVKLRQILFNLIGNALKFTPSGKIEVAVEMVNHQLQFSIKDSGIGIPQSHHELIFERFRQVETNFSQQYGGTGLGLSISRSLIDLLGGKIWLESKEGEGSSFYFTIPCCETDEIQAERKQPREAQQPKLSGKTILIAEDKDTNYLYLQEVLQDTGVKLIRARNGVEAVFLSQKNPILDLILMDIKMPLLDGFDATRQIRLLNPSIPIIAQTAYSSPADRTKALEAGCNEFLAKPISDQMLLETICEYIC